MQLFDLEAELPKPRRPLSRESVRALCWTFQQLAGTFLGSRLARTSVILWDQVLPEVVSFFLARAG
jgi:hypothetical protein